MIKEDETLMGALREAYVSGNKKLRRTAFTDTCSYQPSHGQTNVIGPETPFEEVEAMEVVTKLSSEHNRTFWVLTISLMKTRLPIHPDVHWGCRQMAPRGFQGLNIRRQTPFVYR